MFGFQRPALNIPAKSWADLDQLVTELTNAQTRMKEMENLILNTQSCKDAHGITLHTEWSDPASGKRSTDFIIDGASRENALQYYRSELDSCRAHLVHLTGELGEWHKKNAHKMEQERRSVIAIIKEAIADVSSDFREAWADAKGKTPEEYLHYVLFEKPRPAALAAPQDPEPEEPKPEPEPPKVEKQKKDAAAEWRRRTMMDIAGTVNSFGVFLTPAGFEAARAVIRFSYRMEEGKQISKVTARAKDIALALGVESVSVTASPSEAGIIRVDVPRKDRKPLLYSEIPDNGKPGQIFIGESVEGKAVWADISILPHLLIAGTTGSGKSTFLNGIICQLLKESGIELFLIDPKQMELAPFAKAKQVQGFATTPEDALSCLDDCVEEMERRCRVIADAGAKDLDGYNERMDERMRRRIIAIDELADLMNGFKRGKNPIEAAIIRIAQKGRAAGIHVIAATQRPSADVITGLMKANIPSRAAFTVASNIDSRIILDEGGAENLTGKGDMLWKPVGGRMQRLQAAYTSNADVEKAVKEAGA